MKTEIKINDKLLQSLENNNIVKFTQIQEQAIPLILDKQQVLGIAQTGTGKTLAFCLPLINNLMEEPSNDSPRVLFIAPTRDLAMQIFETVKTYIKGAKLGAKLFIGGRSVDRDVKICKNEKFDIVVANPGRLMDLSIKRKVLRLSNIECVVLDEADQMLDMGFLPDIRKIYRVAISGKVKQSLMFSATMPKEIIKLAEEFLDGKYQVIKVNPEFNVFENMTQTAIAIKPRQRIDTLVAIVEKYKNSQAIIFTRTRREAKNLEGIFTSLKISATSIHSDKSQSQRANIIERFKKGSLHFLIATDVMARGIDIKNLPLVINYNLPDSNENYIHRIGRTARAGAKGIAVTIVSHAELKSLQKIEKMTKYPIDVIELEDSDFKITTDFAVDSKKRESGRRGEKSFDKGSRPRRSSRDENNDHFSNRLRGYDSRRRDDSDSRNKFDSGERSRSYQSERRDYDSPRKTERKSYSSHEDSSKSSHGRREWSPRYSDSRKKDGYSSNRSDSRRESSSKSSYGRKEESSRYSDSRKKDGYSFNRSESRGESSSKSSYGRRDSKPYGSSNEKKFSRPSKRSHESNSDSRRRDSSFEEGNDSRKEFFSRKSSLSGFTSRRKAKKDN